MMRFFATLTLLYVLFISTAYAGSSNYYMPPEYTKANIQISDSDHKSNGHFTNATGSFRFDKETTSIGHLKIALDARSIASDTSRAAQEIRSQIDSALHSEISFRQADPVTFNRKGTAEIKGTLSFKGDIRDIALKATLKEIKGKSISLNMKTDLPLYEDDEDRMLHLTFKIKAIKP